MLTTCTCLIPSQAIFVNMNLHYLWYTGMNAENLQVPLVEIGGFSFYLTSVSAVNIV